MGLAVRDYSGLINRAIGARDQVRANLDQARADIKAANVYLHDLELAQALLQKVAQDTQGQLKIHVEDIVQLALDAIFPNQYDFEINFEIAYGKVSARLIFRSCATGYEVNPLAASGGGVVDVCSFALRLACFTLARGVDKVIILDEPFRFLSADLQGRAGELLKQLGQKLGLQIIMTTHLDPLIGAADRVFKIALDSAGVSQCRVIGGPSE